MENLTFMFSSAEKRAMWEEAFNDAKHKLGEQENNTSFVDITCDPPWLSSMSPWEYKWVGLISNLYNKWFLALYLVPFSYLNHSHTFKTWIIFYNFLVPSSAMSADRRPPPEFVSALPIRKTRAGLQFTCATATLGLNAHNLKDVWVCNRWGEGGYSSVFTFMMVQDSFTCMTTLWLLCLPK